MATKKISLNELRNIVKQIIKEESLNEAFYHVVDKDTDEIIISYDVPRKAEAKANELNKKYNTDRYIVK